MATCKYCSKSGWLLLLDNIGLCDSCHNTVLPVIISQERAMSSAINIATSTKNPSIRLARIGMAISACKELKRFETGGFPQFGQSPSTTLSALEDWFQKAIPVIIHEVVSTARQKSGSAATDAAQLRPYAVAQDQFIKLAGEVPTVSDFHKASVLMREEQDRLRFELVMRKAELAELKGKPGKAIEYTIDALSGLTYDQTPDHAQSDLFAIATNNLRRLGSDVPSQFRT